MFSRLRLVPSSLPLGAMVLLLACVDATKPTLEDLAGAPETQFVDGHRYALRIDLWRDFQPGDPPSGLIARVELVERDSLAIPVDVDMDYLWVWTGADIWETPLEDEQHLASPWVLVRLGRDGPEWETGQQVQVVARIVAAAGETHFLRLADQTTMAVW